MKTNAIVVEGESRKVRMSLTLKYSIYSFDIYLFNSLGSVEMFYSSLRTGSRIELYIPRVCQKREESNTQYWVNV